MPHGGRWTPRSFIDAGDERKHDSVVFEAEWSRVHRLVQRFFVLMHMARALAVRSFSDIWERLLSSTSIHLPRALLECNAQAAVGHRSQAGCRLLKCLLSPPFFTIFPDSSLRPRARELDRMIPSGRPLHLCRYWHDAELTMIDRRRCLRYLLITLPLGSWGMSGHCQKPPSK